MPPEQLADLKPQLPAEVMGEEETLRDVIRFFSVQAIPSATGWPFQTSRRGEWLTCGRKSYHRQVLRGIPCTTDQIELDPTTNFRARPWFCTCQFGCF